MIQATSDVPQCDHLVSPLEAMAKALIESEVPEADWDHIRSVSHHPLYELGMQRARAALLALAECELPHRGAFSAGEIIRTDRGEISFTTLAENVFRAMLVAISEGE